MSGELRPRRLKGGRVSLAAVGPGELEAEWLPEAAQAIAGRAEPCRLEDRIAEGDQAWWIRAETPRGPEVVGAAAGRLAEVDGATRLVWSWLAVAAEWRGYGYGGASVPLLERAAARQNAVEAVAPLPPDNGIALYFWLRLGYVPDAGLRPPEAARPAGAAGDALWMRRRMERSDETADGSARAGQQRD